MSINKTVILLLFVLFYTSGYSQVNITDSLDSKRESFDGYYFQNDQFCDKLEEFTKALNLESATSVKETPLIIISNSYCQKDSLYTIFVKITDIYSMSPIIEPNSNYIFTYGGKIGGRFIFLKEKSIFGKMVRSEFNFVDKLKEISPSLAEFYSIKCKDYYIEGSYTVKFYPFMSIKMNKEGDITDVKYHFYDAFNLCTFDLIENFINRSSKK